MIFLQKFRLIVGLSALATLGCGLLKPSGQLQATDQSLDKDDWGTASETAQISEGTLVARALGRCSEPRLTNHSQFLMEFDSAKVPNDAKTFLLPAWLSYLSYFGQRRVENELAVLGFTNERKKERKGTGESDRASDGAMEQVQVFNLNDLPKGRLFGLQGFVAQGPRGRFLVIRGSDSVQDWLVNFEDETVKLEHGFGPEVKVHNGFKEMFDGAYKVVEPVLQQGDRHYGDLPIWVIGHSLGGAQALLFGAVLAKQGFNVGAVVTLAQPRVGNVSFANEAAQVLGDRYVTIAHELDIVPHTPATVVAAAAAAAHFLAGTPIPKRPGSIKKTYETNDYQHFGARYILGADGVVSRAATSYDDDDVKVFEDLNAKTALQFEIGSKVNPVTKTRLLTQRLAEHFPQQIFCKMAQAAGVQAVSDW